MDERESHLWPPLLGGAGLGYFRVTRRAAGDGSGLRWGFHLLGVAALGISLVTEEARHGLVPEVRVHAAHGKLRHRRLRRPVAHRAQAPLLGSLNASTRDRSGF
jgi:hypothetical protein